MQSEWQGCPGRPLVEALVKKDREQNGKLDRIEKQVNRILWAIIGGLAAVVMALMALVGGLLT